MSHLKKEPVFGLWKNKVFLLTRGRFIIVLKLATVDVHNSVSLNKTELGLQICKLRYTKKRIYCQLCLTY